LRIKRIVERAVENWPAKVLALAAAILLFVFHGIATVEEVVFTIDLELRTDDRLASATPRTEPVRVVVRGGPDDVERISGEDIRVVADFTGYTEPGTYVEPIRVERYGRAAELHPLEIRTEPAEVTTRLEEVVTREVQVEPVIVGAPERGYHLAEFFLSPESVQVSGPRSLVEGRELVATEPIDLDGRAESFTAEISLRRPTDLIEFRGIESVRFTATVEPVMAETTFVGIQLGVPEAPEGVQLIYEVEEGSARVRGPLRVLEELSAQDFRLEPQMPEVDLTAALDEPDEPANYPVPVSLEGPEGITVVEYEPTETVVDVLPAPLPPDEPGGDDPEPDDPEPDGLEGDEQIGEDQES